MNLDERRALLEARQARLAAEAKRRQLAWLDRLAETSDPALLELAVQRLGFRRREWQGDELVVVDGDERIPIRLDRREIARLVRARHDAGWSHADVRPLIRPGAARVPSRYEPLGYVVDLVGELPEVVLDVAVEAGTTIAFEVGPSYREWIIDSELGYVGYPPPASGAEVWRVHPG